MSCEICNIYSGSFSSEKEYQNFLIKLGSLIEKELLKKNKDININTTFFEEEYICLNCNQKWQLLVPDQAFRGGWNEKEK